MNTELAASDSREQALQTTAQQQGIITPMWHEIGEIVVDQSSKIATTTTALPSNSATGTGRWLVLTIGESSQQFSTRIGSHLWLQNERDSVLISAIAPDTAKPSAVMCTMKFNDGDERAVTSLHDSVTTRRVH